MNKILTDNFRKLLSSIDFNEVSNEDKNYLIYRHNESNTTLLLPNEPLLNKIEFLGFKNILIGKGIVDETFITKAMSELILSSE
jgi:hypothetical protein